MFELRYREARPADSASILKFQLAMARETEGFELEQAVCADGVRAVFQDANLGRYYVAERGDRVVGVLLVTFEWSDWRNGRVWWIQSVFVTPAERGKGIYSGLYRHVKGLVEKDARARGLRLYVHRSNHHAQKVYAKLGMSKDHYEIYEWMKTF